MCCSKAREKCGGEKKKKLDPGHAIFHLVTRAPSPAFSKSQCPDLYEVRAKMGPRTVVLQLSELKQRLQPAGGGAVSFTRSLTCRRGYCHHLRSAFGGVVTAPAPSSSVASPIRGFGHLGPATVWKYQMQNFRNRQFMHFKPEAHSEKRGALTLAGHAARLTPRSSVRAPDAPRPSGPGRRHLGYAHSFPHLARLVLLSNGPEVQES